jgi:predicted TIM-barrel fold metal-dependent hydrolase
VAGPIGQAFHDCTLVPDAGTRRRILVDNPATLYGFAAT